MREWTPQELQDEVNKFPFWYHKIDLGQGVVTPGLPFDQIWNMIREARGCIDYRDKAVLDLASFDGLWAFEAERLGASRVVATDCYLGQFENFLFARDVLRSKVVPYYNVSPYRLDERLDVYLDENFGPETIDRRFDVVQHLGLFYHLRDPMLTLSQARSVVRSGGYLLLETAAYPDEENSHMVFNGTPPSKPRIYEDISTWWAPTIRCLKDMLRATLFEPLDDTVRTCGQNPKTLTRMALVAKAVDSADADRDLVRELYRTYRNPGINRGYLSGFRA